MSLLGLLDVTPETAAPLDVPAFPNLEFKAAEPLTEVETEHWNDIVEHLGSLTLQDDEDPPIWSELSTKYASLMLGPEPTIGQLWDTDDWIAADFEDTWSMATPIWSNLVAPPQRFHAGLWQRSTRRSRPPIPDPSGYEADAPGVDTLEAALRVIKAVPQTDEAAVIPPASQEVRSRLAPLQRRTAGASNAAEMAERAASPELLAEMERVAARRADSP